MPQAPLLLESIFNFSHHKCDSQKFEWSTKKKEKESKVKIEQEKLSVVLKHLDTKIQEEKENVNRKVELIKTNQTKELNTKGANTERINKIDWVTNLER